MVQKINLLFYKLFYNQNRIFRPKESSTETEIESSWLLNDMHSKLTLKILTAYVFDDG